MARFEAQVDGEVFYVDTEIESRVRALEEAALAIQARLGIEQSATMAAALEESQAFAARLSEAKALAAAELAAAMELASADALAAAEDAQAGESGA